MNEGDAQGEKEVRRAEEGRCVVARKCWGEVEAEKGEGKEGE